MQSSIDSTDGDLARAVAARASDSIEAETELYRRFAPRVRLYGLRHLRREEDGRDLVQQVLLLTIEKLRDGLVRDTDRIASFILGVSRTMAKDLKRWSGGARSCWNRIVSRSLLNRLQRDGVHVRLFSLSPGETVPCAVFPGDDLVITVLRADLSGVDAVTLSVRGPEARRSVRPTRCLCPVWDGEVLWAWPAALVRQMPSMRLQITLASAGDTGTEVATYALDHSADP
jgi:DNA-directed RNA polymerase specialized sigma24 family protein